MWFQRFHYLILVSVRVRCRWRVHMKKERKKEKRVRNDFQFWQTTMRWKQTLPNLCIANPNQTTEQGAVKYIPGILWVAATAVVYATPKTSSRPHNSNLTRIIAPPQKQCQLNTYFELRLPWATSQVHCTWADIERECRWLIHFTKNYNANDYGWSSSSHITWICIKCGALPSPPLTPSTSTLRLHWRHIALARCYCTTKQKTIAPSLPHPLIHNSLTHTHTQSAKTAQSWDCKVCDGKTSGTGTIELDSKS